MVKKFRKRLAEKVAHVAHAAHAAHAEYEADTTPVNTFEPTRISTSWELELKKEEIRRIYETIQDKLFPIIKDYLPSDEHLVETKDFSELMGYVYKTHKHLSEHFIDLARYIKKEEVGYIRQIRNTVVHNNPCTEKELNKGIKLLIKFRDYFCIKPERVPLRIMACKNCNTIITRTAQPTTIHKDLSGTEQNMCRVYNIQHNTLEHFSDNASRENTWYDSWVWSYVRCAKCHTVLGFRFDWAPEELVDLSTSNITYMLERQAMVVTKPNGDIEDLTHVVSDGKIRHHHYSLLESMLVSVPI